MAKGRSDLSSAGHIAFIEYLLTVYQQYAECTMLYLLILIIFCETLIIYSFYISKHLDNLQKIA